MSTSYLGRRWHLVEFHELNACPALLRFLLVETLELIWTVMPYPQIALKNTVRDLVLKHCDQTHTHLVVDMASGAGGPMPTALGERRPNGSKEVSVPRVRLILTDYFPQVHHWRRHVERYSNVLFCPTSVDATRVVVSEVLRSSGGVGASSAATPHPVRTICGALHHFSPPMLQKILEDAVRCNDSVYFFEPLDRLPYSLLMSAPFALLATLLAPIYLIILKVKEIRDGVTQVEPLRVWVTRLLFRIVFTYLIPLLTILITVDGVVSCLRTYSPEEFKEITDRSDPQNTYMWSVERHPVLWGVTMVTYKGIPKRGG